MRSFIKPAALLALFLLQACSTSKLAHHPNEPDLSTQPSHVEIDYFLGHNQYKFTADGTPGHAEVTTFLEKSVVEQGDVDLQKYSKFLNRAVAFAEKPRRDPSQETDCRSPFSVSVKIGLKSYTSKGCRSSDEGGLSRLVRDGEFLLYSKK